MSREEVRIPSLVLAVNIGMKDKRKNLNCIVEVGSSRLLVKWFYIVIFHSLPTNDKIIAHY